MAVGIAAVGVVQFTGRNGSGNISVSGVEAGDLLVIFGTNTSLNNNLGDFTATVQTTGQIEQLSNSDYSAQTFTAIVVRAA